jgi:hypothetical protein
MSPQLAEREQAEIAIAANRAVGEGAWLNYGLAIVIYLFASALTRPIFISDTMYYLRTANPSAPEFWDFGHLFWRPLVWILLRHLDGPDFATQFLHAFRILDFLSTVAGLVALCFMVATLRLMTRRTGLMATCAVLLSFSQMVLTYSKGGCAYIFGFLALSIGFYGILRSVKNKRSSSLSLILSGASLAWAVCLWFPYILAVPGVLLAPLLLAERPQNQRRPVLLAGLSCFCALIMCYGCVAIHLHLHDVRSLTIWASTASHGITISGATRVIFGFARSFISLGENGSRAVLFKRFVLHDAYNPIGLSQIFGLTLWKILLFYLFLASTLVSLARSPGGRRVVFMFLATALPVLGFACAWQGSDLERYFPLLPVLMFSIGLGLSNVRFTSMTGLLTCAFVAELVIANISSLSGRIRQQELQQQMGTVRSLSQFLPADSLVLLPPMHPLQRVYWDFPELLPLAQHGLKFERIVDLKTADTPSWRQRACSQVGEHWNKQIPVVIESSLLKKRPPPTSYWVEGDDPRVHWRDIHDFVAKLEIGSRVGDTDFFLIAASAPNMSVVGSCR